MRALRRPPRGGGRPDFPPRWHLRRPQLLADTRTSRVWQALRADGSRAVVKAIKPAGTDELHGAALLRWRRGEGLVRLYAVSGHRQLLEHAGGTSLAQFLGERGDIEATDIAAEVLARLSAPSRTPAPAGLTPLSMYFASLFTRARGRPAGDPYREAARMAERLLRAARDARPLHGDLHHDNILHGPRGWLAIDPRGLVGDAAFDAANLLYNPLRRDDLCLDAEHLHRRAETYARALGQELPPILAHAYAYGCLSAAWHAEDGNAASEARELAVAAKILELVRAL
ncbi:aminoglycoside phosphotransferase family protein [Tahibacter caeni]|uniref:aminoglycoside phosphotransferase family protein n=1 Tax=Tahibacter caeni TaxID=1453545 RepID=UPI0021475FF6|nr:aminoglycoside phosphotransferase family protein [Tahibacter caeni]